MSADTDAGSDQVDATQDDATQDEATQDDAGTDNGHDTTLIARLEREGDIAADYLEELLDIADLDGDLDIDVEADRAAVSIVGAELTQLVGGDGEVLEALQELTRLAVYRETGERSRLMLDISGFRADKRARLSKLGAETAAQVRESGEPVSLDPMSPFERKIVHDAVAAAGLRSESAGTEPRRYVVVLPADS
ncbi:single-stranded DNA-binding protein [Nocardioides sp. zg-ZUI104]|uniref:Jag family protein n=1 Tax=Nocardioides faecalis TaxID=2803858 RepID=UPI001BCF5388|nr:R3H domain-containing nucleic acid-binding protein [Nocardioides faecalis]MBS4753191.1 single-stranded DNA-binding protein [Nocardioides faecalis]